MITATTTCRESNLPLAARSCKICQGRASGAHFGVDSCRACAAFFRRSVTHRKKYLCRLGEKCNGGRDCRKCRYDRCIQCGMPPELVNNPDCISDQTEDGEEERRASISSHIIMTSNPRMSLLHRIHANYRELCALRLSIENVIYAEDKRSTCPLQWNPSTSNETYELRTARYDTTNILTRATVGAFSQFFQATFDEFVDLNEDEKWILYQNYWLSQLCAEGFYRAVKSFPDMKTNFVFVSYTSLLLFDEMDEYYKDSRPKQMAENVSQMSLRMIERSRDACVDSFRRLQLTELEFVALLALILWSPNYMSNTTKMERMGAAFQSKIFHELHVLYRDELKLDDYSYRLGDFMCLVASLEWSSQDLRKDLHLFYTFDVFGLESILPDILIERISKE